MTVHLDISRDRAASASGHGWRDAWRGLVVRCRTLDVLAAMTAASLPWSTTAPAILMVLWLVVLVPTIDWDAFARNVAHPACALPLSFLALAIAGVTWTDGPWSAGLHGIKPVAKLLAIPFLLYHFQRSTRETWVFAAFLISCTLMMILSWTVLFVPSLKIAPTVSDGVPVKNYIDQSQEFALCAFALALPALTAFRQHRLALAAVWLALALAFVVNMMFVITARTALVYMPALLVLFAVRHLSRRAMLALFAAVAVAAGLVWSTSPHLRQRIADVATEYRGYENNEAVSTAQRLHYWQKSIAFFAEAPLYGHGTGSTRQLFAREAVGQTGLSAEVVSNPHNQTLNVAVQWGLLGGIILYGMWFSHLLLFRGEGIERFQAKWTPVRAKKTRQNKKEEPRSDTIGTEAALAAWIGLVTVVQNIVSSLLNSHLFDFHEGWMYVLGVGVAGGMSLRARQQHSERAISAASQT